MSDRVHIDSNGNAVVRDTGLRVTDVMDIRAHVRSDEELLARVPMLQPEDLADCYRWIKEEPTAQRFILPLWSRVVISFAAGIAVASLQYLAGGPNLGWVGLYLALTFLATWGVLENLNPR